MICRESYRLAVERVDGDWRTTLPASAERHLPARRSRFPRKPLMPIPQELLDRLDSRHDELIRKLDDLNAQIEAAPRSSRSCASVVAPTNDGVVEMKPIELTAAPCGVVRIFFGGKPQAHSCAKTPRSKKRKASAGEASLWVLVCGWV